MKNANDIIGDAAVKAGDTKSGFKKKFKILLDNQSILSYDVRVAAEEAKTKKDLPGRPAGREIGAKKLTNEQKCNPEDSKIRARTLQQ